VLNPSRAQAHFLNLLDALHADHAASPDPSLQESHLLLALEGAIVVGDLLAWKQLSTSGTSHAPPDTSLPGGFSMVLNGGTFLASQLFTLGFVADCVAIRVPLSASACC